MQFQKNLANVLLKVIQLKISFILLNLQNKVLKIRFYNLNKYLRNNPKYKKLIDLLLKLQIKAN